MPTSEGDHIQPVIETDAKVPVMASRSKEEVSAKKESLLLCSKIVFSQAIHSFLEKHYLVSLCFYHYDVYFLYLKKLSFFLYILKFMDTWNHAHFLKVKK